MHPDRTNTPNPATTSEAHVARDGAPPRSARASRARKPRRSGTDPDAWINSHDGQVAHERALEDLARGHVQHLDHAEFLEAFEVAWIPAGVEWTVTDEFARRYGRLRGRSHRAIGAALTAFLGDLAQAAPHTTPKGRAGLQLRRLPPDSLAPDAWALAWSTAGRATYLLEWRRADAGPVAHVTWLTIGPHSAPDRRRWRGNA